MLINNKQYLAKDQFLDEYNRRTSGWLQRL